MYTFFSGVKSYFSVIENKCADFYADAAVTSGFFLSLVVPYYFFNIKDRSISGNAYYVAKNLFYAVSSVGWEARYVGGTLNANFCNCFDMAKTFVIWHPNGKIQLGYISSALATLWSYFIKALYHYLLVAKRKKYII
ncbi:hypothetical protein G9A89_004333 [Geosiphon pyriformis]|nr:hypothetical protein G9A89_004333 [Geosiphon pyriformis]